MSRQLFIFLSLLLVFTSARAETETYRFERYWPTLRNPWYFNDVNDIAVGNKVIYVADGTTYLVQKFTPEGMLFDTLASPGEPLSITLDKEDNLYLLYGSIQVRGYGLKKYDREGNSLWETFPLCDGAVPSRIVVDNQQDVLYLSYKWPVGVNRFDIKTGDAKTGKELDSCSSYWLPLLKDSKDKEYIIDEKNKRGVANVALAVDSQSNLYVLPERRANSNEAEISTEADSELCKYAPDGKQLWEERCVEHLTRPGDIELDANDVIHIPVRDHYRILKFDAKDRRPLEGDSWSVTPDQAIEDISKAIKTSPAIVNLLEDQNIIKFLKNDMGVGDAEDGVISAEEGYILNALIKTTGLNDPALYEALKSHFSYALDVAIDRVEKRIFTTIDYPQNAIKQFSLEGELKTSWNSSGGGQGSDDGQDSKGKFYTPLKLARDSTGHIYVSDTMRGRIVKFTANGEFVTEFGGTDKPATDNERFILSAGIAVDKQNNIYVVDMGNLLIKMFKQDPKGTISFCRSWGGFFNEKNNPQGFYLPYALALNPDNESEVYVTDIIRGNIRKFILTNKEDCQNLIITDSTVFGGQGSNGRGLNFFTGIAVHQGQIYVSDMQDDHIEQFDLSSGQASITWGGGVLFGKDPRDPMGEPSELGDPSDVEVDEEGNVYVGDTDSERVLKFTPDCIEEIRLHKRGECAQQIGSGIGDLPGQFRQTGDLLVAPDGKLYVTDLQLNRIQVFNFQEFANGKAIIVAGKAKEDDSLWTATKAIANWAYYVLLYKGFRKDEIRYLSADTELDLDGDKQPDVFGEATTANFKDAIDWAKEGAEKNLTLFMIDHGGQGKFYLKENETLSAETLAGWLGGFDTVKLIYEACYSGSFLRPHLEFISDTEKSVVITSAGADKDQVAKFDSGGSLAFTSFFLGQILHGAKVGEAFDKAEEAVKGRSGTAGEQTPRIEGGRDLFIGNEIKPTNQDGKNNSTFGGVEVTSNSGKLPNISGSYDFDAQTHQTLSIAVEVTDPNEVGQVYATVNPSGVSDSSVSGQPVVSTPRFDLTCAGQQNVKTCTGEYSRFFRNGLHDIAIYATDKSGNISAPKTITVNVSNVLRHKAVIVEGSEGDTLGISLAVEALKHKGFNVDGNNCVSDSDICRLTVKDESIVSMDKLEKPEDFKEKTQGFLNPEKKDIRDLVIFLYGLTFAEADFPSQKDLAGILDDIQENFPDLEHVTVICEGSYCQNILAKLGTEKRVVIASTPSGERTQDKLPSFSRFFWQEIATGRKVLGSFNFAKSAAQTQRVLEMDSNGNGQDDNQEDNPENLAEDYSLGEEFVVASVAPNVEVLENSRLLELNGETSATINKVKVTTVGKIKRVWAVITSPVSQDPQEEECLTSESDGSYSLTCNGFVRQGNYEIQVFAEDTENRISSSTAESKAYIYQGKLSYLIPSKSVYRNGDEIEIKLPTDAPLPQGYEQYLAVTTPDRQWYSIHSFAEPFAGFTPFNEKSPAPWEGTGEIVFRYKVDKNIPRGVYQLHLIRLPKDVPFNFFPPLSSWGESIFRVED